MTSRTTNLTPTVQDVQILFSGHLARKQTTLHSRSRRCLCIRSCVQIPWRLRSALVLAQDSYR